MARKSGKTATPKKVTPLMQQYFKVKNKYPDAILLFRVGDFYETFGEDAVKASQVLGIVLTSRNNGGSDIELAGFPHHSMDLYLPRLVKAGFRVAICEQLEKPSPQKKIVKRGVTEVVTPGIAMDDKLLDHKQNNYLAAVSFGRNELYGLAFLDISTGEFLVQPVALQNLAAALERVEASEILLPERLAQDEKTKDVLAAFREKVSPQPSSLFDSQSAQKRLEQLFGVGTLDSFGAFSRAEIAAAGALIDYVERTQKGKIPHLSRLQQLSGSACMEIDAATRRNLEMTRTLSGERKGSLLDVIDCTITGAGARLLQTRLSSPLTDIKTIHARQDEIESFSGAAPLREALREQLKDVPDMERALARLTIGRATPRDLGMIRDGLRNAETLRALLQKADMPSLEPLTTGLQQNEDCKKLSDILSAALETELPAQTHEGRFIAAAYDAKLDQLRTMRDDSKRLIAALQTRYREETKIETLKIAYNNMLGYYIDVTARHADKLLIRKGETAPDNPFVHRQTLANNVRFTTADLVELERDIASAADKALAIEQNLFVEFTQKICALAQDIGRIARAIAALDVAASLAHLAVNRQYIRPTIDNSLAFDIRDGRHPVVEEALRKEAQSFVPNNCDLGEKQRLWLLTGPNMAGKSTFLRQNALIVILAQMGAFVPARSAHIGLVDRCFSRVGAADDLARGRSTFMVEMVETATILNQATQRSLVILDEIGRGTATFDGLSIAWACVEQIHETNRCRALFATHYHELTSLSAKLSALSCHAMQVKEWKGDVIFLHSVAEGAADRSYGIHVARLAGLPENVVARAQNVLDLLNKGEQSGALAKLADDLPLFTAQWQEQEPQQNFSEIAQKLEEINPDDLTPKEALEQLYILKDLL